jgi:2-polyprenyl-3-methyl-5-hydroxy-6-metoxy-1,4-benzoquinol methylase
MPATDRLNTEQAFHDRQAEQRSETFSLQPDRLRFPDTAYLGHETWIEPAFRQLGDVRGRRVLDFGCGHGMAAVVLARRGACVTAFDLSFGYIDEARMRAAANSVAIDFIGADGHRLPFADGSFDRIWGNAVLHHLDISMAAGELCRVLRPGGIVVFCEPWGENRLLNWARRQWAGPAKQHTPDEQPLRRQHLKLLRQSFSQVEFRGFQLLALARRVLPPGRIIAGLDWCDRLLLSRVPALQRYCRYVVLTLRR